MTKVDKNGKETSLIDTTFMDNLIEENDECVKKLDDFIHYFYLNIYIYSRIEKNHKIQEAERQR